MLLSKKREVNMLSGPIVRGLLTIAIPIMVMNVIQSMFNVVDMTILKIYDTDATVGAVGACSTLITLITGLLVGVSTGANVVIARFIGQGNRERVEKAVGTAILFAATGGLVLTAIGVSLAEVFLGWMQCPETLLPKAALYFRLYFAGVPILMVYNFCAAILRSTGDSRRPMVYLTLGGIVKVAGTFVFVGFFRMSVEGVAIATILSWTLSAVLGLRALLTGDGTARLLLHRLRFYKAELSEMLTIGIPAGLQQALYSIANVIIAATVNSYGEFATTGISIANTFDGILYQIAVAPSLAIMPYVSQNVGCGNIKRATQSVGRGMMITVALGATFGALSAIFSGQLASIMSDNPEVIRYAQQKMVIISSTYFITGINEILGAALRGMKRPLVAMISTMIFMCGIRFIWVFAIFNPLRDRLTDPLTFLYMIWPIGWILSIITLLSFFFPTVKRLKKNASMPKESAA